MRFCYLPGVHYRRRASRRSPAWRAARTRGLADSEPASLVLTNPPFGRVRLSVADRRRFARALFGHANRATLFLHDAVARLEGPGAAAAFVLPAAVVGGAYFQRLRSMLVEEAPPAWLAFVADREGSIRAMSYRSRYLGVFVQGGHRALIECERIVLNGAVARDALTAMPMPDRPHEPWLLPRQPADTQLLALAAGYPCRLDDYGWRVSTGPLVWNRHREQLFANPGPGRLPVVWAQDVRDGRIEPSNRRPERWCQPLAGQEWLVLNRPAVLVQRTTAPEQPRRIVAGHLDAETLAAHGGRVVVENHLNVCTWNGSGPVTAERLIRFFGSHTADRLYRCMTGSVAVSAFELHALPLPPPQDWRRTGSPPTRRDAAADSRPRPSSGSPRAHLSRGLGRPRRPRTGDGGQDGANGSLRGRDR